VNGFTFDPARPQELASMLRRLAKDEPLLPRLRAGARNSAVVTTTDHAAKVRAVYESALAISSSRRASTNANAELDFLYESLVERQTDRQPAAAVRAASGSGE